MEFLLVNHPLDCPICDQGGECDLQVGGVIMSTTGVSLIFEEKMWFRFNFLFSVYYFHFEFSFSFYIFPVSVFVLVFIKNIIHFCFSLLVHFILLHKMVCLFPLLDLKVVLCTQKRCNSCLNIVR